MRDKNSIIPPTTVTQNLISSNCTDHFLNILINQVTKLFLVIINVNSKLSFVDGAIENYKPSLAETDIRNKGSRVFHEKTERMIKIYFFFEQIHY